MDNEVFIEKAKGYDFYKNRDSLLKTINLVDSKYFTFIDSPVNQIFLFVMQTGDFSGEAYSIYSYVNDTFKNIFLGSGNDFIEIYSNENSLFLISRVNHGEVGTINGNIDIVNYPLYNVFKFYSDTLRMDSTEWIKYNLDKNIDFEKYLKMKNPVLTRDSLNNLEFTKLIDLGEVKQN